MCVLLPGSPRPFRCWSRSQSLLSHLLRLSHPCLRFLTLLLVPAIFPVRSLTGLTTIPCHPTPITPLCRTNGLARGAFLFSQFKFWATIFSGIRLPRFPVLFLLIIVIQHIFCFRKTPKRRHETQVPRQIPHEAHIAASLGVA